jgi:hypothetical protein
MKKGIITILEVIITSGILLAAFNFFFPRYRFETNWRRALLITVQRDSLVTMDRLNKTYEFINNPTELENFLNKTLPAPYLWWVTISFSNGTKKDLIPPASITFGQEVSYLDVDYFDSDFEAYEITLIAGYPF